MTTLDEVIKAIEVCRDSYVAGKIIKSDALHYLKEYRDECNNIVNVHDDYIHLRNEMQDELSRMNPPLTWDELKQMEGKPVWIEDGLENGEWYIIECFTESGRFIAHDRYADDTVFKAIDMGNMWQAYRKERS